ncbi:uncharacterized protein LOC111631953 [Centruroides sculpturatus]|uniref:uncharacterized protein LOC111631953 n=1 Tax=Centruroides sculpturatus TaxID=218467 RepID=UPI000C6D9978|nr:uncharacterized protein LOC111631953 [Centruroides sculpturatus]
MFISTIAGSVEEFKKISENICQLSNEDKKIYLHCVKKKVALILSEEFHSLTIRECPNFPYESRYFHLLNISCEHLNQKLGDIPFQNRSCIAHLHMFRYAGFSLYEALFVKDCLMEVIENSAITLSLSNVKTIILSGIIILFYMMKY